MKVSSSKWLKEQKEFPKFAGWGEGYAALTCDKDGIVAVKNYIINQEVHHKMYSFRDEYIGMIRDMGLELDERHWES